MWKGTSQAFILLVYISSTILCVLTLPVVTCTSAPTGKKPKNLVLHLYSAVKEIWIFPYLNQCNLQFKTPTIYLRKLTIIGSFAQENKPRSLNVLKVTDKVSEVEGGAGTASVQIIPVCLLPLFSQSYQYWNTLARTNGNSSTAANFPTTKSNKKLSDLKTAKQLL